jgi:hypothetical protein
MPKNIVFWAVWQLLLTILFIFTENPMPLYLLLISVLVPVISLSLSAIFSQSLEVELILNEIGEKEQGLSGRAILRNQSRFPFPMVNLQIHCRNLLTGEEICDLVKFSVIPRGEAVSDIKIIARNCGKMHLKVNHIRIYDFFGLCSYKRKCAVSAETLILPMMFPISVVVGKSSAPDLDCDTFSLFKAGNDPSETFAIRDYKPGDTLRSIHWKLTGKFDKLMVREASLPINESVLILFERVQQHGDTDQDAAVTVALGEIVVSLSRSLTDMNCAHCIGWLNAEDGNIRFNEYRIDSEESFSLILPEILGACSVRFEGDTVDYCLKRFDSCPFSNIIYVSSYPTANLSLLNPMSRLSMIICARTESVETAGNSVAVYSVTPENYSGALYQILI